MTEPDEALLYAREHWATICDEDGFSDEAEAYRRGLCDKTLVTDALFYRAGAAASEARIKALEEALAKADEPRWFYADEEASPCHSLEEAVEESIYEIEEFGNRLLVIPTARPCATIFGVVRILTEDEIEARGDDNPWTFTRCATKAEAIALLKEADQ